MAMVVLLWLSVILALVAGVCVIVYHTRGASDVSTTLGELLGRNAPSNGTAACSTKDCQYAEWLISTSVDIERDPCGNFYDYVCSGIVRKYPSWFNSRTNTRGILDVMQNNVSSAIDSFLSNTAVPQAGQSAYEKAAALHQICMELEIGGGLEHEWEETLKSFGISPANLSFDPLEVTVAFMLKLSIHFAFSLNPAISPVSKNVVVSLSRSKEFVSWKEERAKLITENRYRNYVREVLEWHSVNGSLLEIAITAETNVIALGAKQDPAGQEDYTFLLSDIGSWRNDVNFTERWSRHLSLHSYANLPGNLTVYGKHEDFEFFMDLYGSNSAVNSADLRMYIAWTTINQLARLAGILGNRTEKQCKDIVMRIFPYAAMSAVFFETSTQRKMQHIQSMTNKIRTEISQSFLNASWWDKQTRDSALEKLAKLKIWYAYPPTVENPRALETFYAKFPDVRGPFMSAYINVSRVYAAYHTQLLAMSTVDGINYDAYLSESYLASTAYVTSTNSLYVRAAVMNKPAYIYGGPDEINYGALGRLIASGIMRGFDAEGRKYDVNGRVSSWWTDRSESSYLERENCVKSTMKGIQVSTYIQDMMAERSVYNAYKKASKSQWMEVAGTGDLTRDQLFYVSWCLLFCGEDPAKTGVPVGQRCNMLLKNSELFAEAFSCPSQSPMNSKNKCNFW
ncbi:neprilysin-1-like isoform X2 [Ornithodoros turicata]